MVKLNKLDTMLFRMIKNSKGQFIAALVIIVVGISVYTSLSMTAVNMRNTVNSYYAENNFPNLFIEATIVPNQKIEKLKKIKGVQNVTGRVSLDVPLVTENLNERVNLRMITMNGEREELSQSTLIKGRMISDFGKEALLIQQFADARGIKVNDVIKVQIKGVQYSLDVVGIVENPEYIYLMENAQSIMPDQDDFGVCYVSEKFGQQAFGSSGSYNQVLVSYVNDVDEDTLIEDIKNELDQNGIKQTIKRKDQLSNSMIDEELNQLDSMSSSLPILFLLVAGFMLMMMLGRMVKKDRMKIGILQAMGYTSHQVLFHYIKYALIVGVIGGFLGSLIGMALAGGMTKMYLQFYHIPLLKIEFYYSYIALAMILSAIFCTVSGLIGSREVLKITPADAMRAEAPKIGKRILLEKFSLLWKNLSFSNKMIAKNIFRNKKRTIFILVGVILTYGMMLFTTSMPSVMDQMMNKHFVEFQKMDYNISFIYPIHESAMQDMTHLIDVDYMEGKIEYPFELTNGNKKQSVIIVGIDKDTSFYSFKEKNGTPIMVPQNGILLSENLAKALQVEKGDAVRIKSFLHGREDVYLRVKGIIKQALGMNAYMEIGAMGEQLLEKNIITGVYVNSKDEKINEKLLHASNVATVMSVADTLAVYEEYMELMALSMGFMVLFSGILGFCIVYNATIISVMERQMEFSSLRVLGFRKKEIFFMIVRENNIIMILGILIGIPIGKMFLEYSSSAFSTDLYTFDMSPTLMAGILAGVYTVGFILAAQLATYRKINQLDFLQALKNREA
ncbi:ABC transporter permease [Anaerovorax sp. IOR16]|uniref:ABC transporter permease n=1 Tax=Anaerovorax sp. IOR16 TaxID=2773458 RepID=UPI0019D26418|nr:FtsX-like permease family protein [Anaerovorax sp. IOR16]